MRLPLGAGLEHAAASTSLADVRSPLRIDGSWGS